MLATELLVVYVYCLVDDAIKAGALLIPRRPGPLRPVPMPSFSRSHWSGTG